MQISDLDLVLVNMELKHKLVFLWLNFSIFNVFPFTPLNFINKVSQKNKLTKIALCTCAWEEDRVPDLQVLLLLHVPQLYQSNRCTRAFSLGCFADFRSSFLAHSSLILETFLRKIFNISNQLPFWKAFFYFFIFFFYLRILNSFAFFLIDNEFYQYLLIYITVVPLRAPSP